MPGVPTDFAEHKLHVQPDTKPVRQPLCRLSEEKRRVVGEEIARILAAGFIMEVFFPEWLANPVLVLKKNKHWRMCIDYTSLNKACPKDPFALPRIDQVIDSTVGCKLLRFFGCILRVPSDKAEPGRQAEDRLHHAIWSLLLPDHDVRLVKCRRHVSALHAEVSPQATRQKCPCLCG